MVEVRRLGPGDEAILELLAAEDADFDVEGRGGPREPLPEAPARAYLADPHVLFWAALDEGTVVGFLSVVLVPLRSGAARELLLYEIGVRQRRRRRGVGRAMMAEMGRWMRANGVSDVWVLADNRAAVAFYHAMGFRTTSDQPRYMVLGAP